MKIITTESAVAKLTFFAFILYLFTTTLAALAQSVPVPGPGRQHPPGEEVVHAAPSIQALTAVGDLVYAGSFGNGLFRSADRGMSWTGINSGLRDPFILSLAI